MGQADPGRANIDSDADTSSQEKAFCAICLRLATMRLQHGLTLRHSHQWCP